MGLKYFTRYRDSFGDTREVRFYNDGFDGAPTEWVNERAAVRYTRGSSDTFFPDQPIIASQAQIGLILKERYDLTEFVKNRKTFYVEVFDTVFSRVIWSGWLEPWDARHNYEKPPYVVNLTASCGLAHLSKKKYVNPNSTFKKTGLQIIQDCLGVIGRSDLPIRLSTHMFENGFTGDSRLGLTSFEENTFRYYDDNGEALHCDVIVNNLLNHFNAEITQWNNMWVIRAIVDNATSFDTSYLDTFASPHPIAWPSTFSVNGSIAKSLDGGEIRTLAPINKYRTEIDFGQQKPFFENGNMLLWAEDGLVGWDFTHMPKGNPGWEKFGLGGESGRSVLKINGKSPQPYRKKKKKKFGQILVPILTGMVGANLKNTYYDVEPSQYIESPGGSISKADKSVTISFDYETEAFSSDILISIRIPVTKKNGDVVNFWVDPSSSPALSGADKSKASASEAFCLIRVPPVDMGKLTDKGMIDVSSNPNYPAANWTPGSKNTDWTWTVTGVPEGEYRRIGGVNGVLVENGDLVVARVANGGGSQEAVGSSWEIIGIRNNVKKGTFSLGVSLNTTFITKADEEFPADKVFVRFYKMADDAGKPGDWYKVYNLNGVLEGFVASEESARYATTLERGDVTDEEADTINLISGDFTPWYVGTWTRPGTNDPTSSWRRRPPLNESYSVYRAMMKDRLCMTTKALAVFEGKIHLLPGDTYLHYLHKLYFIDQDKFFRIVRFSYDDSNKQADVTAVEILYEEIPDSELKQDSYIPGSRQLNTVPGQGDGIYPSKQDSTNGRLNAEDMPLTEEELFERLDAGSRLDSLFDDVPSLVFVATELSTDYVDLSKYLSDTFLYNNANQEEEDAFDPTALEFTLKAKPAWVSAYTENDLLVGVTGKPTTPGSYEIVFNVTDPNEIEEAEENPPLDENGDPLPYVGTTIQVVIPIIVFPKTKLAISLLEIVDGEPDPVGALPGSYPVPVKSDIQIAISGPHDFWQFTLEGGGETGKAIKRTVNQFVPFTNSGIYRFFLEDDGYELPVGIYRLYIYTQVGDSPVSRQDINFVLYDEEFLAKAKFFFTSGGTDIGEIDPSGTSIFPDPGAWDSKSVIDGVEHDKAIIRLNANDGSLIKERVVEHGSSVTDFSYFVYEADQVHAVGQYNVSINLLLAGEEVMVRYADFTTVKKVPEAVGGALQLLKKSATGVNFSVVATLPKTGTSAQTLVPWNIGSDAVTDPFDWEGGELFELKGGGLIKVDVSSYTGRPPYVAYPYEVTFSDYREFDNLSSEDIGKIHGNNKTFRYIRTRKLGGQSGDTVAVFQADFSFGTLVPIEDDVEVEEPGSGYVDFRAREGMSEEVIDYVKYFDGRGDGLTIEIKEPGNPDKNWFGLIEKGVLYKYIQDMPADTVLGRRDTAGTPGPIQIKKLLADVDPGDLVYIDVIQELINQELEGYMPISSYTLDWNLVNSDGGSKYNTSATNNPLGGGTIFHGEYINHESSPNYGTSIAFRNNRGFFRSIEAGIWQPWLEFADRAWVTANYVPLTRQILNGIGLSGGGPLSADRTLSVVYGTAAGTSAQGNDTRINNGQTAFSWGDHSLVGYLVGAYSSLGWSAVNTPAMFRINTSATDNPFGGGSIFHGVWIPHDVGTTYGTSLAFRNNRGFFRSLEAGSWQTWLEFADRAWVDAHTVGAGAGLSGGGTLGASPVISLGLPSTLSNATTNSTSGSTHTHAIQVSNLLAGTNVSLSASGAGVILGPNNITINVGSFPWTGITGKPTTLDGFGITDGYTEIEVDLLLLGKENTFSKGDIIQGAGLSISGTLTDKLVGSADVTFALAASGVSAGSYGIVVVDIYGRVTGGSNPTTLSGHGITNAYTKSEVDALIAGAGGLSGSGANSRIAVWGPSNTLTDGIMNDTGSQISIAGHLVINGGSFSITAATLPGSGTVDGELRYSAGSYYYWQGSSSTWKKVETL